MGPMQETISNRLRRKLKTTSQQISHLIYQFVSSNVRVSPWITSENRLELRHCQRVHVNIARVKGHLHNPRTWQKYVIRGS